MARIQIPLPERFSFETCLSVRIGDINYGGHLANDALLRLAHEARLRWLRCLGYASETAIEGAGIIIADAAVCYRAEAFHGDALRFALAADDLNRHGFDLLYAVSDDKTGKEVARLKTGVVFFDYQKRKVAPMPEIFAGKLCP
ncbi:thioesterase [Xenophilus sp. AP218F]|nr:thioesterase family protein [Chromobacterium sp. ASV5]OWY40501.1 thioesterase [Xenophilus sp. AP218F]